MNRSILVAIFLTISLVVLSSFLPSCAHMSDTCDTYCIRNGGQCVGVDYGARKYNASTGEFQDKPTYFHCRFIN